MMWGSVLWVVWESRNEVLFSNKSVAHSETLFLVQMYSWNWYLSKTKLNHCLIYERCGDSFDCISMS